MAGIADFQDRALREWLSQVMSGHAFVPGLAGCQCGWGAPPGTDPADQGPWLEHRTDVILDILEFTAESQNAHAAQWEQLADDLRRHGPQ